MVVPGCHVNSNKPHDDFLIPLRLTWEASGVKPGETVYPTAQEAQVGEGKLSVFTGDFDLKTPITVPSGAAPGTITLTATLHYQACNDRMCFRPSAQKVQVPLTIE
jgi:DsbC/DsbD-like thiol-disulfide interchange protein